MAIDVLALGTLGALNDGTTGGSSNVYTVDGTALITADGTLRISVWLLLDLVRQNATTAPTVNFVRDDGTVVVADGDFTKAEEAETNTWLLTKTNVTVTTQYNYHLTVEFAGDSGPERTLPVEVYH